MEHRNVSQAGVSIIALLTVVPGGFLACSETPSSETDRASRSIPRLTIRASDPAPLSCACHGTGPGDVPVTASCGETACGSDYYSYACGTSGWSWTGQPCTVGTGGAGGNGGGSGTRCQCQGTGPGNAPVTASCGETACGSDYFNYTCSDSGWSWTGQSCLADEGLATNASTSTTCAEHDNVNVALESNLAVASYVVEATHPSYAIEPDNCQPDFTNCPPASDPSYSFTPARSTLFDDHETVVMAVRDASWWRPQGMSTSVDSGMAFADAHYIAISRKIPGSAEWPQFMVLYADGNLRLIPFPPEGRSSVCFGSSVIVGPVVSDGRPIAEIAQVNYMSATKRLAVTYRTGESSVLDVSDVDRSRARVQVMPGYITTSRPFAAFRSMFVADGNADVDHVSWTSTSGPQQAGILGFSNAIGPAWFFYRATRSLHNTSAPDIRLTLVRQP